MSKTKKPKVKVISQKTYERLKNGILGCGHDPSLDDIMAANNVIVKPKRKFTLGKVA